MVSRKVLFRRRDFWAASVVEGVRAEPCVLESAVDWRDNVALVLLESELLLLARGLVDVR